MSKTKLDDIDIGADDSAESGSEESGATGPRRYAAIPSSSLIVADIDDAPESFPELTWDPTVVMNPDTFRELENRGDIL